MAARSRFELGVELALVVSGLLVLVTLSNRDLSVLPSIVGALLMGAGLGFAARRLKVARFLLPLPAQGAERAVPSPKNRETRHLRSIVASMSDGVLVANAEGANGEGANGEGGGAVVIELSNPAWQRLFGGDFGAGDLEVRARIERMIRATSESGKETQEEIQLPGTRSRTALVTGAPLAAGSGVVLQARDLTSYLRLSEMRRDFVGNVSHELRTPLAAIRGYAETLIDGALDDHEVAPRFIERIVHQCGRLELLLLDLLALSSLEHTSASEGFEWLRLDELLSSAAETIVQRAEEKGVSLELEIESAEPFLGHPDALERLCLNLLQNAITYNRPQGRVQARLFDRAEDLVLEVEDTGIGIPEGDLDRVFERFYRVDKGRSRGEGGTGLGLAIAKHAAQLHGGSIEVESEPGRGSLFRVILPRSGSDR